MTDLQKRRCCAKSAVQSALRSGRLFRPEKCSFCNKKSKRGIAHHHRGYKKKNRLNIQWLCDSCHKKTHLGISKKAMTLKIEKMLQIY